MSSQIDGYFRDAFRAARAVAQQDAEGFYEILFVLERFGSYLAREIFGLGKYEEKIKDIAKRSVLAEEIPRQWSEYHSSFSVLYDLVQDARNDALHQGAFARHLTDHAIQLSLIIEDALMGDSKLVSSYMVRGVVCASLWQPVSFARQQMLANSFSYLPLLTWKDGQPVWGLLSDCSVAQYLQSAKKTERRRRLATPIEEAIRSGLQVQVVEPAKYCYADTTVVAALNSFDDKPLLIVDKKEITSLIGIVTAFDLL